MTSELTDHCPSYFRPGTADVFHPTHAVGGGWNPDELHIAPVLGLLTHRIEREIQSNIAQSMRIGRLCFDILGVLHMEPFEVRHRIARSGRTIELHEAQVWQRDRLAVHLRAWTLAGYDTAGVSVTEIPCMPQRTEMDAWEFESIWPGGFVRTIAARRSSARAGRCKIWIKTDTPLLEGEDIGPVAQCMTLIDVANGSSPAVDPQKVAFPNVDVSVHLIRSPVPPWFGLDTSVSIGRTGLGLTQSYIHDEQGALGIVSQCLTVRPLSN